MIAEACAASRCSGDAEGGLVGKAIRETSELSLLTGGGVSIDGDINGDGQPDVTLLSAGGRFSGFTIVSSGNELHGLVLRGFDVGVSFLPAASSEPLPMS